MKKAPQKEENENERPPPAILDDDTTHGAFWLVDIYAFDRLKGCAVEPGGLGQTVLLLFPMLFLCYSTAVALYNT